MYQNGVWPAVYLVFVSHFVFCGVDRYNILSLVAYSNDGSRPCLVYMENGSLAECLLGKVYVCGVCVCVCVWGGGGGGGGGGACPGVNLSLACSSSEMCLVTVECEAGDSQLSCRRSPFLAHCQPAQVPGARRSEEVRGQKMCIKEEIT